ncbi:hypothetical protein KKJ09_12570 [Xenorhabdus bovienii]|uniref:hypothetical protein n=1 Tax=Xenorhabdus bovienii TaxID=40576 RepID=UPI0023B3180B|nr:hypothetical protein [Xenorhabdus bovienii]MDE9494396.1 hypothetical protein [Xenorhabdus bovienii]MDE9502835.1 hypothetical protein [Xenorhabdus bovienii]MDE9526450.1 hypothetical protein [Xenorhabdus bovienii]
MITETSAPESNTMTLEAMLSALDASTQATSPVIEPKLAETELSGLSELELMAAELEKISGDSLGYIRNAGVAELTPVLVVESEPVPEPVEVVSVEESVLDAALMELSATVDPKAGAVEAEAPEVIDPPAKEVKKEKKESIRPRFQLIDLTDKDCEKLGLIKEAMIEAVAKCPVKAQDKALNIAQWALRSNELSVYTQLGIECLIKNGTATSESFRLHMMSNPSKPYPTGTAGTQASQLMAVLPAMGMATRDGRTVTLSPESPLVKLFQTQSSE